MKTNELKKYTVSIFGESYSLLSDESQEHIEQAAQAIDNLLQEVTQKAKTVDAKKAAILVAFRLMSKIIRLDADTVVHKEKCNHLLQIIQEHGL